MVGHSNVSNRLTPALDDASQYEHSPRAPQPITTFLFCALQRDIHQDEQQLNMKRRVGEAVQLA
jgi:hypothetical protein